VRGRYGTASFAEASVAADTEKTDLYLVIYIDIYYIFVYFVAHAPNAASVAGYFGARRSLQRPLSLAVDQLPSGSSVPLGVGCVCSRRDVSLSIASKGTLDPLRDSNECLVIEPTSVYRVSPVAGASARKYHVYDSLCVGLECRVCGF